MISPFAVVVVVVVYPTMVAAYPSSVHLSIAISIDPPLSTLDLTVVALPLIFSILMMTMTIYDECHRDEQVRPSEFV